MSFTFNGPTSGPLFLFAHGAGAAADSSWMTHITLGLANHGIRVARFNFPYMIKRQQDGKRRPPDRQPVLLAHFLEQLQLLGEPAVIGGKSMGGRMASVLAANIKEMDSDSRTLIKACACLGYPFHPNGKPEKLRIDHFDTLEHPTLIIQGTRDPMGSQCQVREYPLPQRLHWHWLTDGDHDFKPRVASGFTHQQHLDATVGVLAAFIKQVA